MLQHFERDALGFGIEKENHEELYDHHGGEKNKRDSLRAREERWKNHGNERIHRPVGGTAETLPLCPYATREDLAYVYPNDRALGDSEERNVGDQQP